jgi:DNA invertase Pin-like site-specific DNA recombinase
MTKHSRQQRQPRERTAVIYARFSCSKQREASIEDQLRVCRQWCANHGHEVVAEYCDYAISGRTDERPQFQRMVEHAGESAIVLVYMMDRFSRDAYDAPVYKRILRDHGTKVVSATEAMPDGPEAILLEKVYEGLAAIESAHIAQRTKRGMEGNALKCMHNGVPVFGYDFAPDGRYAINEAEAAIVREVFARRRGGETANAIATDLAKRGYRTMYGNPVGHTWVTALLRNEKYCGVYKWGDVRIEGGMPAIISRREYDMTQAVKSRKQRKLETWRDYPLAGRIICGGCGRNMVGKGAYNHAGKRYDYYSCPNGCGMRAVRADWAESAIVAAIRAMLADRERTLEIAQRVAAFVAEQVDDAQLEDARKRRDEAQRGIENLTEAVAHGMPWELAAKIIDQYRVQVGACEAEIAMLEHQSEFSVEDFTDFLQFGATLDDEHILEAFVAQVLVMDDSIVVALNVDANENREPVRLTVERVREVSVWLPSRTYPRTLFALLDGSPLIQLERAA